jgi:PAS domain S-box-containing protein
MSLTNTDLTPAALIRLFNRVGECLTTDPGLTWSPKRAVETLAVSFELSQCCILILDEESGEFEVAADFHDYGIASSLGCRYKSDVSRALLNMIKEGLVVKVCDEELKRLSAEELGLLQQFMTKGQAEQLAFIPLTCDRNVKGMLFMRSFSTRPAINNFTLDICQTIAESIASTIHKMQVLNRAERPTSIFSQVRLPLALVDMKSGRIIEANPAFNKFVNLADDEELSSSFQELVSERDYKRFQDASNQVSERKPVVPVYELAIIDRSGNEVHVSLNLSYMEFDSNKVLVVSLLPDAGNGYSQDFQPQEGPRAFSKVVSADSDDKTLRLLNKQLKFERLSRQLASRLHSSLDRDAILQAAVDTLGRGLSAHRCLVIRSSGLTSPVVAREFAELEVSLLGVGRTATFPVNIVGMFKDKTVSISNLGSFDFLGQEEQWARSQTAELRILADEGVQALLGTPIMQNGVPIGVLILLQYGRPRKWTSEESEMLELTANELAIALQHSEEYKHVKDQLLNLSTLANLTQHLSATLTMSATREKLVSITDKAVETDKLTLLSVREMEVLKLIASGLSNREIAQRLFLTESTVELHASRIKKKLKLKTRTALVKYACDNDVV